MLTDEVIIKIKAGKGGDGAVSFRREKYQPRGGPDGGDGGKGGNVVFSVTRDVNTLTFFDNRKEFKADDGENGGKNRCHGGNAKDLILRIPPGTIIYNMNSDQTKYQIVDLTREGEKFVIAKGGRGGWGNTHFSTATHQTPYEANNGTFGQEKTLKLELQLIADVGFIGLPNAGKSTLLSHLSNANPKIANYPFTTLEPNLGVVKIDDNFSFIAADIPGLIEGASHGKGLGDKFLRHIQRTSVIVHLIDINSMDPAVDYKIIRDELKKFNPDLVKKKEIVVFNKIETVDGESVKCQVSSIKKVLRKKPLLISAATGQGLKELLFEIKKVLK